MFDKVLKTIEKFKMIDKNDCIVVGVSGGADSVCLLHILSRLSESYNLKLRVVHINHCLRGEDSDADERYVEDLCGQLGVSFFKFSFDIKNEAKRLSVSEEEAGRIFRYKCFYQVCDDFQSGKIAVAHNKNDNAETIVMRFIRGTGIKGLCGISPVRKNIIRPLIECERFEIERYCFYNNLDFRVDITNTFDVYTRNKIRLRLFPWISKNLNENIVSSVVRNAEIISDEELFLEEISDDAFYSCSLNSGFDNDKEVVLETEKLLGFNIAVIRRVLRKACRFFSKDLKDLSYSHINMLVDLAKGETGKFLRLPSSILAEKGYNCLKISYFDEKISFSLKQSLFFNYELMYNKVIKVKETNDTIVVLSKDDFSFFSKNEPYFILHIDKNKVKGKIKVRSRIDGDCIFVKGVGNKKLKKFFSEKKILQKDRGFIPIVCDDENVICAVGVCVSDLYKLDFDSDCTKEFINIYFWRSDSYERDY